MIRLLVIADDLTGANDTGVQFSRLGIPTIVSIHAETPLQNFAENCEVLVVNTESRHLKSSEAYHRVLACVQQGVTLGIQYFYKKTDSTLRGNIGLELEALFAVPNQNFILFAPAYPKLNRTTKDGTQLIHGAPLHQTLFAEDRLNPMKDSFVPNILNQQTEIKVEIFTQQNLETSEPKIYVLDAESDEDLRTHARKITPHTKLLAGSAGWAACLPEALQFNTKAVSPTPLFAPMLIVNGSLHENSLRQVEYAAQQGIPVVNTNSWHAHQKVLVADCLILTTDKSLHDSHAAEKLANQVRQILARSDVRTLVVFGGDTLAAIAQTLHWKAFRPRFEIFDGIPVVEICEDENLLLVTKAGGFGEEDLIMKLMVK